MARIDRTRVSRRRRGSRQGGSEAVCNEGVKMSEWLFGEALIASGRVGTGPCISVVSDFKA